MTNADRAAELAELERIGAEIDEYAALLVKYLERLPFEQRRDRGAFLALMSDDDLGRYLHLEAGRAGRLT